MTAELVMGHFFKTQPKISGPNPTQPTKVFTRPNPTHRRHLVWHILGYTENFIQQLLHVTDKFTVRS